VVEVMRNFHEICVERKEDKNIVKLDNLKQAISKHNKKKIIIDLVLKKTIDFKYKNILF